MKMLSLALLVAASFGSVGLPARADSQCDAQCHADLADRAADRHDRMMEDARRMREEREDRERRIRAGGCGVTFWNLPEARRLCRKGRLYRGAGWFGDIYYSCECRR